MHYKKCIQDTHDVTSAKICERTCQSELILFFFDSIVHSIVQLQYHIHNLPYSYHKTNEEKNESEKLNELDN